MDTILTVVNRVLARYRIEPITLEEIIREYRAKMPVMSEAEKIQIQESLRRLWLEIAEKEVLKTKEAF